MSAKAIDRSMTGPPRSAVWNPTLFLLVSILAGLTASTLLTVLGSIAPAIGGALNAVCLYAIYTVHHEAVHGLAHRNRAVNRWMGRIAGLLEGITFPLFKLLHLQHHAHTNDPAKDPDQVLGRKPRALLPLWLLIRLLHDHGFAAKNGLWKKSRGDLFEHMVTLLLQGGAIAGFVLSGHGREVLALWLAPLVVAAVSIYLSVGYAVHYPHEAVGALRGTRMYEGGALFALTLGQSRHLVHHLWPQIPWFRYELAAEAARTAAHQSEEESLQTVPNEVKS